MLSELDQKRIDHLYKLLKKEEKTNPIVDKIEALEPEYKALSDYNLIEKTEEFKERLSRGETLDDILPEAFATVREASARVLGMRPYRVQLIGGDYVMRFCVKISNNF